jgi:hypothetical protein
MNDFKFAFHQLLKNPGFTAVAVIVLGLGIGANVAVLVPGTGDVLSEPQLDALREQIQTFSGVAAHASTRLVARRGDMPTRRTIAYVT